MNNEKKHYLKWLTLWGVVALGLMACNSNNNSTMIITSPDTTPPVVLYTAPAASTSDVATNSAVTATFSETMSTASLTPATFYIDGVSGTVTVSADKRSATFTPASPLAANTAYTATITTGAKDSAGNKLASAASWSFTTSAAPDTTSPQVSSVTPPSGSKDNQASTTTISVTFNEAIDCASLTTSNVQLLEGSDPVPMQMACNGSTIKLLPIHGIPTNTDLTASVGPSITDLAANPFGNLYTWSFGMAPWTRELGTPTDDIATAVTSDGAGNVYVAGYTSGALDGQANSGNNDLFVTKYDVNGNKQWTRELGTPADDAANAIISDSAGNVYLAGYTHGSLDGQPYAGGFLNPADLFITKYDTNGNKLWTRELGTTADDVANAITYDGAGNVYVAGFTGGALDGQTNSGGIDIFVTKYDTDGNKQWTRELGPSFSYAQANAITYDGAGNIYVAGFTWAALDGQTYSGSEDLFITKYDVNGNKQWTRELGSTNTYAQANAITSDGAGNVYVAGATWGTLDGQTSTGGWDFFATKYDANGNKQWTRQFGTGGDDGANAITSDGAGNVYLAGYTSGALDDQVNAGSSDLFITKIDVNGNKMWTRELGTAGSERANAITSDGTGNLSVAGFTNGALDGQANAGSYDAFVIKYQTDGRKR